MWRQFVDWLALTSTERKVILFLAGTFVIGAGIRLYSEAFPTIQRFDYHASDSTFADLSSKVQADASSEERLSPSKVNLNEASKEQLLALPGIGDVVAERILQYKKERGSFTSVEELLKIKGISKKKLEQIKNFLTIDTLPNTPLEE